MPPSMRGALLSMPPFYVVSFGFLFFCRGFSVATCITLSFHVCPKYVLMSSSNHTAHVSAACNCSQCPCQFAYPELSYPVYVFII